MTKTLGIRQLFTPKMVDLAKEVRRRTPRHQRAEVMAQDVITPEMARINEVTGQENDAKYMAYLLDFSIDRGDL